MIGLSKSSEVSDILQKALAGETLDYSDGLTLMESDDIHGIAYVANGIRKKLVGDTASFVVGYNMNYSNVCAASCQICAFYRRKGDEGEYTYTVEECLKQVAEGVSLGATEIHIVGGLNPYLPIDYYEDLFSSIRREYPQVTVKALTMAELFFLAKINRSSVGEMAQRFREAGLKTMTGGGAEILHPDVRPLIARGKLTGEEWLRTAEDAHNNGITSNSTMLYGHLEKAKHRIDHIIKIRELQAKTHGFLSFIPLKFSLPNTELLRSGGVGDPSSAQDDIKVIAVSRLLFGDLLKNIAVYWVSMGKHVAQVALNSGGNDLIGTSFSEKIYKEAGRDETISIEELTHLIREAGRVPVQRDTFYNPIRYM